MRGIPERWEDYQPFKQVMMRTPFLAVKVPLNESYLVQLPPDTQFSPKRLMDTCRYQGIRLGLIVDLTFTTRYYSPQEFTSRGIRYEKIFVEGHNVPSGQTVAKFKSVINQFRKSAPDSVVAVHCTHGVNRTGYMICRYLIDEDGWDPEAAIAAFGESRGFPIERENYLSDLRGADRSGDGVKGSPKAATSGTPVDVAPSAGSAATSAAAAPPAHSKAAPKRAEPANQRHQNQHVHRPQHQHQHHRNAHNPYPRFYHQGYPGQPPAFERARGCWEPQQPGYQYPGWHDGQDQYNYQYYQHPDHWRHYQKPQHHHQRHQYPQQRQQQPQHQSRHQSRHQSQQQSHQEEV